MTEIKQPDLPEPYIKESILAWTANQMHAHAAAHGDACYARGREDGLREQFQSQPAEALKAFETAANSDDIPNCWYCIPTHWMPLPAAPEREGGV